jgi:hypothetical protein
MIVMSISNICRVCLFRDICEHKQTEAINRSKGYAAPPVICEKETIMANGIPTDFLSYRVDIDRELDACPYYHLYSQSIFST